MYINDLAMVVFTGIKHTADWFLASFKENEVASCECELIRSQLIYLFSHCLVAGFIDWAKGQIERYAEMFRKQVYSSDVEKSTVDEASRITYSQSKKVCLFLIFFIPTLTFVHSFYKNTASISDSFWTSCWLNIPRSRRLLHLLSMPDMSPASQQSLT